jgi:glycosyltransferase involved in cell wall biosynthesis
MHKVSIILPVYNVERYLATSLDSVLAQTHENWELLISDNCSKDATGEIAAAYADRDKRIVYLRNETNIGVMANYNKCIERATGEYIELFGGDDLFEPQCLEKLVQVLDSNPNIVLVTCARNLIDEHGQHTKVERPLDATRTLSSEEAIRSNLGPLRNWIMSPVMYRSKYKGRGFDTSLRTWADLDYWVQILRNGDLYYLDELLFSYRVHAISETSRAFRDLEFLIDLLRLADRYGKYIINPEAPDEKLEHILAAKVLALFNHATRHRDATFDALLAPLSDVSVNEIIAGVATGNESQKLRELANESHDHRRSACLALLCAADLECQLKECKDTLIQHQMLVNALEENRDKVRAKRDAAVEENDRLNKLVDELKKDIVALKDAHNKALGQRDEALKERDAATN